MKGSGVEERGGGKEKRKLMEKLNEQGTEEKEREQKVGEKRSKNYKYCQREQEIKKGNKLRYLIQKRK